MTLMSAPGRSARLGRIRIALEISEHGPRIDPQIARGSGPIAPVSLEDLEDVLPGEVLAGLRQWDDCTLSIATEVEVLRSDQGLIR